MHIGHASIEAPSTNNEKYFLGCGLILMRSTNRYNLQHHLFKDYNCKVNIFHSLITSDIGVGFIASQPFLLVEDPIAKLAFLSGYLMGDR